MSTPQRLDTLCAAAMARITASINRSAGQHLRAMQKGWRIDNAKTQRTRALEALFDATGVNDRIAFAKAYEHLLAAMDNFTKATTTTPEAQP